MRKELKNEEYKYGNIGTQKLAVIINKFKIPGDCINSIHEMIKLQ